MLVIPLVFCAMLPFEMLLRFGLWILSSTRNTQASGKAYVSAD